MSEPELTVTEQLRALAANYAAGVDQRDAALVLSAFHPDATFRIYGPGSATEPTGKMDGHEQLARIAERIQRYVKTFHVLGQSRYTVDGDSATGETYCVAHHIDNERDGGPIDRVMYIRYQDKCRRIGGVWGIQERTLIADWIDELPTALDPPITGWAS